MLELQLRIEELFALPVQEFNAHDNVDEVLEDLLEGLNDGTVRAATPTANGEWQTQRWVKHGILLLFRRGVLIEMHSQPPFRFFDKHTLSTKHFTVKQNVRIVPGGSVVRNGCYLASGVICMPPMYINIGAYIGEGSMVDSHALVGTCAQVGKRVHISAAAQIGGVLEPAGARPVVIEDDVLVGGNCGVYEGVLVRKRAVLGSGVILNASTPVYDLVNETIIRSSAENPLEIPEGAVVIAGARNIRSEFGAQHGLSVSTPIIVKYRDEKTDARTALEEGLR